MFNIDVGRENVQLVDAHWREGYGEPLHRMRRPSGDQHVNPRQWSEQPHDWRSNKVQGVWWEVR